VQGRGQELALPLCHGPQQALEASLVAPPSTSIIARGFNCRRVSLWMDSFVAIFFFINVSP
jgi:hypothetical protein